MGINYLLPIIFLELLIFVEEVPKSATSPTNLEKLEILRS
jgi:hypothetical protein